MPLYPFYCKNCDAEFEELFALKSDYREGEVACPTCGRTEGVSRRFGAITQAKFIMSKSRKGSLIDKGYKMSKEKKPIPGLKRI